MNKRTLVLCASIGALLLAAAPMTIPESLRSPGLSSGLPAVKSFERRVSPEGSRAKDASRKFLRAAYGLADPTAFKTADALAPPGEIGEPTLWLARAIYSETKLPHEQELVAWVVRNRVETHYRGKDTYREVVLDSYQFSAFNPDSPKRRFLMGLTAETELSGWRQTLWVAYYVRHADPAYRPFSIETRHFYSERSMKERRRPYWAEGSHFVFPDSPRGYLIDGRRFRFFEQIS